ncbi:unnamed protein product [Lathyrus sativus]|nr:unnamed protein product [Lathyrus sativus]
MGNCAGNPKTEENDAPMPGPEPVVEEVNVQQRAVETNTEITPEVTSDEKSLGTLLKENEENKVEVEAKEEKATEVKVEAKVEEKVETVEEAKPKAIEEKTEEAKVEN